MTHMPIFGTAVAALQFEQRSKDMDSLSPRDDGSDEHSTPLARRLARYSTPEPKTGIPVLTTPCDGWVVVSIWLPGKYTASRHAYDHYERLEDAVAYHRALAAGNIQDFAPKGIFPARDGLPVAGPLDVSVIDVVAPGQWKWKWRGDQSTPENRVALERSIFNGRRSA